MNTRRRLSLLLAVALATLGLAWTAYPLWFVARLDVAYPLPMIHRAYLALLAAMPRALFLAAAVLAAVATAMFFDGRRKPSPRPVFPALSPWRETALYAALLALAAGLSWRSFVYWGRPGWDHYWQFGEVLHWLLRRPDPETLAAVGNFVAEYPHSPSPLTPFAVAWGLFILPNSTRLLQIYSLLATAGSVALLRAIVRRVSPGATFWPLGALFLVNTATARNSFFIQLDAINGLLVLLFFHLWLRWREKPTAVRLTAMTATLVLSVFQKTSLFPLLAIPTLLSLVDDLRDRHFRLGRLLATGFWTAAFPVALFLIYLAMIGITQNFHTQIAIMGTGWNELDFSLKRFVFATGFLLGPYLPLIARNRRWREPAQLAFALFVLLFFISIVVVRGPFWGRYYSHVIGACVLLAQPAWTREADDGARLTMWTYLIGVSALQLLMLYWQML